MGGARAQGAPTHLNQPKTATPELRFRGAHFANVQIHSKVVKYVILNPVCLNQVLPIIYMDYFPAPIFQNLILLSKRSTI